MYRERERYTDHWILPIQSLRIGRGRRVPDSSNPLLYLKKLFNSGYPEGNFGGNQHVCIYIYIYIYTYM